MNTEAMNGENNSHGARTPGASHKLYRHPHDHMVGGVCGGVADALGWDPAIVRLLWVVLTFATSGAGFFVYLLLWLMLPVGTQASGFERSATVQFNDGTGKRVALVLIGLGLYWLLSNMGILPELGEFVEHVLPVLFWPAVLIGVGFLLLRSGAHGARGRRHGHTDYGAGARHGFDSLRAGVDDLRRNIPLRRSSSDRMLLGLCGGIGRSLGIDANLVRVVWVLLSLGSMGLGLMLYLFLALVVPTDGAGTAARPAARPAQEAVQDVVITTKGAQDVAAADIVAIDPPPAQPQPAQPQPAQPALDPKDTVYF